MGRKKKTKNIVKKKRRNSELLQGIHNIVLKAIIIVSISSVIALSYTGVRATLNGDKQQQDQATLNTDKSLSNTLTAAIQEHPSPIPTPTKVYHIPLKYRYLFKDRKKKEDIPKIHLEEAKVLFESGRAVFIDARGPSEYIEAHIPGAVNIPVGDVHNKINQYKELFKDKVLVPYCHGVGCHLSDKDAYALFDAGYKKVVIYFGGWPEWTQANMPIEKYEPPERFKHLFEEAASEKDIKQITLEEAKFLFDNGLANIIDVDTLQNYSKIHIMRAVTMPVDKLKDMIRGYDYFLKHKPNIIYCHGHGSKSKEAANLLYKAGYKKILLFKNGLRQWEKAGYNLYKAPQQSPRYSR